MDPNRGGKRKNKEKKMKEDWKEKINRKTITISIIVTILVATFITMIVVYYSNREVREWIDKNIFQKEVMQDKVSTIELKENENANIHAFSKYIGVQNKNKFTIYGSMGNIEKTLEIEISNPIFNSANRF